MVVTLSQNSQQGLKAFKLIHQLKKYILIVESNHNALPLTFSRDGGVNMRSINSQIVGNALVMSLMGFGSSMSIVEWKRYRSKMSGH